MEFEHPFDLTAADSHGLWYPNRFGRIRFSNSLNPESLARSVPELGLSKNAAGEWTMGIFEAYDLMMDNLDIPSDQNKDAGWHKDAYSMVSHMIGPTRLGVALAAVLPLLDEEKDFTPTTTRIFSDRIARKLVNAPPSVRDAFRVQSADFIFLPDYIPAHFGNFHNTQLEKLQYVTGLLYEQGSLAANHTGKLSVARFICHFTGPFMDLTARDNGSPFVHVFLALEQWAREAAPFPASAYDLHTATPMQLACTGAALADALRYCVVPAHAFQSREFGFARMSWLSTCLRFGSCMLNGTSTSWMVDMITPQLELTAPNVAKLIGATPDTWGGPLSHVLRQIERVRRPEQAQHLIIDLDTVTSLELFLEQRSTMLRHLIDEYPDNALRVKAIVSGTLGGQSILKQPVLVDHTATAGQSFAAQAAHIKQQASYMDIKRDIKSLWACNSPATDIIQLCLIGSSTTAPKRRSNAVIITLLLEHKWSHIDPDLAWLNQLLDDNFPPLLGKVVNRALDFPDTKVVNLAELASIIRGAGDSFKPAQFNLSKLAVQPCKQKRFPASDHKFIEHPYRTEAGLNETKEVACDLFRLLGCVDDEGEATAPPLSPRSLWSILTKFIRQYSPIDEKVVMDTAEALMLGTLSQYFKYGFGPLHDGKSANAAPPKFLLATSTGDWSSYLGIKNGLDRLLLEQESKRICTADMPGARFLAGFSASSSTTPKRALDDVDSYSDRAKWRKEEEDKKREESRKQEEPRKKEEERKQQEKKAEEGRQQMLTDSLKVDSKGAFWIGNRGYDLPSMKAFVVKEKLTDGNVVDTINFASLVLRKCVQERVKDAKALFPAATITFDYENFYDMPPDLRNLYVKVAVSQYRIRGDGPSGGHRQTKDKGGGGGGGGDKQQGGRHGGGGGIRGGRNGGSPPANLGLFSIMVDGVEAVRSRFSGSHRDSDMPSQRQQEPSKQGAEGGVQSSTVLQRSPAPARPHNKKAAPQSDAHWPTQVEKVLLAGTGVKFEGFSRTGTGSYLTFLMVSCLLADPCAPDMLVIGGYSGKMSNSLHAKGYKPLLVDPKGSQLPGLTYRGFAEDVAFTRRWKGVIILTPCDDDALSGSQYFDKKIANHTHYWSQYLSVFCFCIPADAALLEHPLARLEQTWRPAHQTVQPYYFGTDDDGLTSKKTTRFTIRGWPLVKATNLQPGDHIDRRHRLKIFDPVKRSERRSEKPWSMFDALADQCNPDTIIPNSWQPDLGEELRLFDANYAKLYGEHTLPAGHGNMEGLFPPSWLDTSTTGHRNQIYQQAHAASGRPVPKWPPTLFAAHTSTPPAAPVLPSPRMLPRNADIQAATGKSASNKEGSLPAQPVLRGESGLGAAYALLHASKQGGVSGVTNSDQGSPAINNNVPTPAAPSPPAAQPPSAKGAGESRPGSTSEHESVQTTLRARLVAATKERDGLLASQKRKSTSGCGNHIGIREIPVKPLRSILKKGEHATLLSPPHPTCEHIL